MAKQVFVVSKEFVKPNEQELLSGTNIPEHTSK